MKKAAVLFLTAALSISFFAFSANAGENVTVFNDKFYAELPSSFVMFDGDGYSFADFTQSVYVDYIVAENSGSLNISKLGEDEIKALFNSLMYSPDGGFSEPGEGGGSVITANAECEKTKMNGLSCANLSGSAASEAGGDLKMLFDIYIYTTEENVFAVYLRRPDKGNDTPAISKLPITSFVPNGTFFDGEKCETAIDFSDALPLEEQLREDRVRYSFENREEEASSDRGADIFASIVMIVIFAVPSVVFITLALVYFVKTEDNKEKLADLQAKLDYLMNNGAQHR